VDPRSPSVAVAGAVLCVASMHCESQAMDEQGSQAIAGDAARRDETPVGVLARTVAASAPYARGVASNAKISTKCSIGFSLALDATPPGLGIEG